MSAVARRRIGGAALVVGGLVVAAIVLWPSGGGDDEQAGAGAASQVRLVSIPQLGLAFAHPSDWRRTTAGRVVRLRSPDGTTVMTFSSPVGGRQHKRAKALIVQALRREFDPARIVREGPGKLGTRTADTVELTGLGSRAQVRALAIVDSTPYRTYAITVITPGHPSKRRLLEVAEILASVQLSKPRSLK